MHKRVRHPSLYSLRTNIDPVHRMHINFLIATPYPYELVIEVFLYKLRLNQMRMELVKDLGKNNRMEDVAYFKTNMQMEDH